MHSNRKAELNADIHGCLQDKFITQLQHIHYYIRIYLQKYIVSALIPFFTFVFVHLEVVKNNKTWKYGIRPTNVIWNHFCSKIILTNHILSNLSNISHNLVGNKIFDDSDVGAAPTTSSFATHYGISRCSEGQILACILTDPAFVQSSGIRSAETFFSWPAVMV